eukprot:scaffold1954_cov268-Pinguiococcus_pyrenoidosus.AAC.279
MASSEESDCDDIADPQRVHDLIPQLDPLRPTRLEEPECLIGQAFPAAPQVLPRRLLRRCRCWVNLRHPDAALPRPAPACSVQPGLSLPYQGTTMKTEALQTAEVHMALFLLRCGGRTGGLADMLTWLTLEGGYSSVRPETR